MGRKKHKIFKMKNTTPSSLFPKMDKKTLLIGILFIISLCVIYIIITTDTGEYPDYTGLEYMSSEYDSTSYPPEDKYMSLNDMEQAINESDKYNISEMEKDMEMLYDTLENVSQNKI